MQIRAVHAEMRIAALRKLIRDYPLGLLTTAIPSTTYPVIQSSHIPWILDVEDESSETALGSLRGHIARGNPQFKAMLSLLTSSDGGAPGSNTLEEEVLVVFTSPIHSYVTPKVGTLFPTNLTCVVLNSW